jgi:hypothetical protein
VAHGEYHGKITMYVGYQENRDDTTSGTTWLRTTCPAYTPNHFVIGVLKCPAIAHENQMPGAVKVGDMIINMYILHIRMCAHIKTCARMHVLVVI